MQDAWEIVSSESRFKDKNLEVVREEIRSPARREPRSWTVVRRKRAAIIAPMTAEGKIILIRQERIPIRAAIWEVPGGQIDDEAESDPDEIAAVALRELREETGFELAEDGNLIPLGDYFTSPGMTDERGYFFLARPVRECAAGHSRDESESILDCRAFTAEEVQGMIASNEIRDANTLAICSRLLARGLLSFPKT
ncbi:MAG TPA: NUDIX hydrolase [Chthoniobacterales bacterium]|nr:NUDIX hydrolase [Chthoniobacterales bacterium]